MRDFKLMLKPQERIIVALDVDSVGKARKLVELLGPHVGLFKIGFQLIYAIINQLVNIPGNAMHTALWEVRALFKELDGKFFLDGKLHDIPNTVGGGITEIAGLKPLITNVHCLGGVEMMKAAKAAVRAKNDNLPLVLGVTVLTSMNYNSLVELGVQPRLGYNSNDGEIEGARMKKLVADLALAAQAAGLDGVIASPLEISVIREACRGEFHIVTPGVRMPEDAKGDQARIATPWEAIKLGADWVVVGRPITKPASGTPMDAAKRIADEIAKVA